MTKDQTRVLEQFFQIDTYWDKHLVRKLAQKLDLPKAKVYKWSWDRRKNEEVRRAEQILKDTEQGSQEENAAERSTTSLFDTNYKQAMLNLKEIGKLEERN